MYVIHLLPSDVVGLLNEKLKLSCLKSDSQDFQAEEARQKAG